MSSEAVPSIKSYLFQGGAFSEKVASSKTMPSVESRLFQGGAEFKLPTKEKKQKEMSMFEGWSPCTM